MTRRRRSAPTSRARGSRWPVPTRANSTCASSPTSATSTSGARRHLHGLVREHEQHRPAAGHPVPEGDAQLPGLAHGPEVPLSRLRLDLQYQPGPERQVVVAGNLNYTFNPHFTVGGGIDALPGVRATEGNFPFWLTMDNRLIADEFFRPSYTMGVWARGKVVDRLSYRLMLGNNLSQLGVDAGQLDDKLNTLSAALIWLPTTGEFGTAAASATSTRHQQVATRRGRPLHPQRRGPPGPADLGRLRERHHPALGRQPDLPARPLRRRHPRDRRRPTRCSAPTAGSSTAASPSRASTTGAG